MFFKVRFSGCICCHRWRNHTGVSQQVRALLIQTVLCLLMLFNAYRLKSNHSDKEQARPLWPHSEEIYSSLKMSGLRKAGRKTPSPLTPAITAAVSTTGVTSSERLIVQVNDAPRGVSCWTRSFGLFTFLGGVSQPETSCSTRRMTPSGSWSAPQWTSQSEGRLSNQQVRFREMLLSFWRYLE